MGLVSPNARNVKTCPFCREFISKEAVRCPHCHADLKIPQKKKSAPFYRSSFMLGFFAASIFWIVLIIFYIWKL